MNQMAVFLFWLLPLGAVFAQPEEENLRLAKMIVALEAQLPSQLKSSQTLSEQWLISVRNDVASRNPNLSKEKLDRAVAIISELTKESDRQLLASYEDELDTLANRYARQFSIEELKVLFTFSSSELGKKYKDFLQREIPHQKDLSSFMMQEAMRAGAKIRIELGKKLATEGIVLQ